MYEGLCIGGPLGGKKRVHDIRYLRAVVEAPLPSFNDIKYDGEVDKLYALDEISYFTYRWERILVEDELFGLWIPEGWTWPEVYAHLFKHYKPRYRNKKNKK